MSASRTPLSSTASGHIPSRSRMREAIAQSTIANLRRVATIPVAFDAQNVREGYCSASRHARRKPVMDELVGTVLRVMSHGSGFSSLIRTTSGRYFCMKLRGVGHGAPGLMTEFIATGLVDIFGLKVPRVAPIMLRKELPWQAGTDEFYDALQRSAGWNLGVEFVDHARDL